MLFVRQKYSSCVSYGAGLSKAVDSSAIPSRLSFKQFPLEPSKLIGAEDMYLDSLPAQVSVGAFSPLPRRLVDRTRCVCVCERTRVV